MEDAAINWIDLVVLAVIGGSMALGAWRGVFSAVFGLIALVVAFYIAKNSGDQLVPPLRYVLGETSLTTPLAYVLVFLLWMLIFGVAIFLVRGALRKFQLGGLDAFGGAIFGVFRGWLLSVLFVLLLSAVAERASAVWQDSRTVQYLGYSLRQVVKLPGLESARLWLIFDEENRPSFVYQQPETEREERDNTGTGAGDDAPVLEGAAAAEADEATDTVGDDGGEAADR